MLFPLFLAESIEGFLSRIISLSRLSSESLFPLPVSSLLSKNWGGLPVNWGGLPVGTLIGWGCSVGVGEPMGGWAAAAAVAAAATAIALWWCL